MPRTFELSGPAFVGLPVRDVNASAEFYEKTLGFRRDPAAYTHGISFLSYPTPFALIQLHPDIDPNSSPVTGRSPQIWFKTADARIVYDALLADGVTILHHLSQGRFGSQFTFADPDGYAITVYDRDAPPDGWGNA